MARLEYEEGASEAISIYLEFIASQMIKCAISVFLMLSSTLPCLTQPIIDNFEQANLDNWLIVDGNAEIANDIAYADLYSARLFQSGGPDAASMMRHKTFDESWGTYQIKCYAVGFTTDVRFRFQYLNENNYYEVACNPKETDNPELILFKVVEGNYTLLGRLDPIVDLNQWFQIRVERTCAGEIFVFINDVLQISTIDQSIRESGSVGLGAWGDSSYFDDLTFQRQNGNITLELEEVICSGSTFQVGSKHYLEAGFYQDTIVTDLGCDSIILLNLEIATPYFDIKSDTICGGDFYIFGPDSLTKSGTFSQLLQSVHGCDSMVELTLWVLDGDTIRDNRTICHGDYLYFGGDSLRTSGRFYETITLFDGCFGILELILEVVDLEFSLGDDLSLCFDRGATAMVSAGDYPVQRWSDGSRDQNLLVTSPGIYWVEVAVGSCLMGDTIMIDNNCSADLAVFIPNGFSPNGDGRNDVFIPKFVAPPFVFKMRVFNRWGALIFESDIYDHGWNGQINGGDAPLGVYLYTLTVEGESRAGSITLVR